MSITRRVFLRNSALAVAGTASVPSFLTRAAFGAAENGGRTKRLVVIFQRGAADGLNIVVPHAEPQYYAMRPSINIPRKAVLPRWFLWAASFARIVPATMATASPRDCARLRFARPQPLALRRTGFHGIRHAGREGHGRWMAQSLAPRPAAARAEVSVRGHCHGAIDSAHLERTRARDRHEQHQRLLGRRPQSKSFAGCERLRSHV